MSINQPIFNDGSRLKKLKLNDLEITVDPNGPPSAAEQLFGPI